MTNYYINRKNKCIKQFKKRLTRFRIYLKNHYGTIEANEICRESLYQYDRVLEQLPYVGGIRNPFTPIVLTAGQYVSIWRIMKLHGKSPDEFGTICYEVITDYFDSMSKLKRIVLRMLFSTFGPVLMKRIAKRSQKRIYSDDWVMTFIKGDDKKSDWSMDYHQCAVCKIYHMLNAEEILPYCSMFDMIMSRYLGLGLQFESTIGAGSAHCIAHFKRGRKTAIPSYLPGSIQKLFHEDHRFDQ